MSALGQKRTLTRLQTMSAIPPKDRVGTDQLKNRVTLRNSSYVRGAPSIVLTVRYFKKIGRKGAQARVDNSTKEQRQEWARKAAIARWRGP